VLCYVASLLLCFKKNPVLVIMNKINIGKNMTVERLNPQFFLFILTLHPFASQPLYEIEQ